MNTADYAVLLVYAATLLWLGLRVGGTHPSGSDLMLGGRRTPTWAALCSMIATELSAATFIGVPHAAYTGDWSYLQLAIGALAGKWVVAQSVIPLYHSLGLVTVYGFLEQRFGAASRRGAALCFVLGRVLASGVRLFIAALALSAATGADVSLAILACGALTALYTVAGGIRSVIWTDVLQGAVFLVAAAATLAALFWGVDGGFSEIWRWAGETGHRQILQLDPIFSIADGRALGSALVGAFFLTLATHATDHDMVQRLLTTRDGRAGGQALLGSGLLNFPITMLFLLIGTGLARFYASAPAYDITDAERILPIFAVHELPDGVRGLLFAGLFAAAMSSLDSAICAIATTWVQDVRPRVASEASTARRMRVASLFFSLILVGAALAMGTYQRALASQTGAGTAPNLVELALSAMTILYGGLAGIFGLGLMSRRRGSEASVLAGLACGGGVGLLLFLHPLLLGSVWIAWTWWIPLSSCVAFGVAASAPRTRPTGAEESR